MKMVNVERGGKPGNVDYCSTSHEQEEREMKRWMTLWLATVFVLALPPATAVAGTHEHGMLKKGTSMGMTVDGGMLPLGDQTVDGVKVFLHLKDVRVAMAKLGMETTHHFMVAFVDTQTGRQVSEGSAAVKIKAPSGKESEPVELIGMVGHFGADVVLADKGKYLFKIGTRLADGKKRQFEFKYNLR